MKIILYENNQVKNLYPITLTRPAFDIMCGGTNLYDMLKQALKPVKIDYLIRDYLKKTAEQKYERQKQEENVVLFLDASLIPDFKQAKLMNFKNSVILKNQNQMIGAYLDLAELEISRSQIYRMKQEEVIDFLKNLKLKTKNIDWPLLEYQWQVITFNEEILASNLDFLKQGLTEIFPKVFVGKNVKLPSEVVLNSSYGPIIINDKSQILPYCHLIGPLYIGKNCLVREFTILKYSCCIGDVCKAAGEIEATVLQGYSNKNHFGFIGYSYLGEWVNLGAGTTNSNLKNNYSSVRMAGIDTGQMFLGCILGDYCRTAINTSIYTGKIIGINSHMYGTIVDDVSSFVHYAKDFGCIVEYDIDKALELQKIVMARRGLKQQKSDIELLKRNFELTKYDRKINKIKKGKIIFK